MLRTLCLTHNYNARGLMRELDFGLHFVYILPPCSARTRGLNFYVRRIDVDLNGIIHFGIHKNRSKRSMSPLIAVEGGNAHQAMYADFRFQFSVSEGAFYLQGGRFNARHVPRLIVYLRYFIIALFAPHD